jgi:hypothetical protein
MVVYDIHGKVHGSRFEVIENSITGVVLGLSALDDPDGLLSAVIGVYTASIEEDDVLVKKDFIGKVEFAGGKRRHMYDNMRGAEDANSSSTESSTVEHTEESPV